MRISLLYLFFITLLMVNCKSSELHTETYRNHEILVGKGKFSDLQKNPYAKWMNKNYKNYKVDSSVVNQLKRNINNFDFEVIMGTWCPDSREQVPVFFAVLKAAGYKNSKNISIIFVPRKYKNYAVVKKYQLKRVPTIIVYENGQELGRIIEYPMESLEKDLLKIISGKGYKHELD